MFGWLRALWPFGITRYLADRQADGSFCDIEGVPRSVVEQSLHMVADAFIIPEDKVFCLRLQDRLHDIYKIMNPLGVDQLDFENLMLDLEDATHREITDEDWAGLQTVEDVIRYMAKNTASAATGAGDQAMRPYTAAGPQGNYRGP